MYGNAGSVNTVDVSNFTSAEINCTTCQSGQYFNVANEADRVSLVKFTATGTATIDISSIDALYITLGCVNGTGATSYAANVQATITLS